MAFFAGTGISGLNTGRTGIRMKIGQKMAEIRPKIVRQRIKIFNKKIIFPRL
jgi:hypothetical protein